MTFLVSPTESEASFQPTHERMMSAEMQRERAAARLVIDGLTNLADEVKRAPGDADSAP